VKAFAEVLKQFPPRHASQIVVQDWLSWWFMLQDGRLIGGVHGINHYAIMGIGSGDKNLDSLKKEFCIQNNVFRVSVTRCDSDEEDGATSEVNVELFETMVLREEQISAIATLAKSTNDAEITWERVTKDPVTDCYARTSGSGTIADFRRFLEDEGCVKTE
jgi:hypothetical protein